MEPASPIDLARLVSEHFDSPELYREILRVPSQSLGLYRLRAGSDDPQRPHAEDESYLVLSGRGRLRIADRDYDVEPGRLFFVERGTEHAFHSVAEDLMLLVFFAPAEGSTDADDH